MPGPNGESNISLPGDRPESTPISEVGEFGLIDRLHNVIGDPDDEDVLVGIDDDAAVYRVGSGRVHVITTDALIEDVHFNRQFTPMKHLGSKAITVNVSDIVAMNARPRFATVALGVPNNITVEMAEELYEGMKGACAAYGVQILGGDTTTARRLTLSVTIVGEGDEGSIVRRNGAQVGDKLCVTGPLGGAFAGLRVLLGQHRAMRELGEEYEPSEVGKYERVIKRQLTPAARLSLIDDWAGRRFQPHALIDISDGLASEVHHICEESGVGALVYEDEIPIERPTIDAAEQLEESALDFALYGGEDYELLFAASEEQLKLLDDDGYVIVGEVVEQKRGVRRVDAEGERHRLRPSGYQHFRDA